MKRRAIIPIFIPHKGCPNDCVFCNQKKITARQEAPGLEDVRRRIEEYLPTLHNRGLEIIEIAFFGGSFTGIPMEEQRAYLEIAREYKAAGKVGKIRLSTRPDYINLDILDQLMRYGVDVIELGAQSFDDEVLRRSNRGHSGDDIRRSAALIREYGFDLGIQLMIGLPGDTRETSLFSAKEAVKLAPSQARLYPTVVLEDTALYADWKGGRYQAPDQEEMIVTTKEMYRILTSAGIQVIRVGLKSTDLINGKEGSAAVLGTYHPAFRQLVCGRLAREELEAQVQNLLSQGLPETGFGCRRDPGSEPVVPCPAKYVEGIRPRICFVSNGQSFSNMVGNRAENRRYFAERYPKLDFRFGRDELLGDEVYKAYWDNVRHSSI